MHEINKKQNKKQLYVIMCSGLWKLKQEAIATPPTTTNNT